MENKTLVLVEEIKSFLLFKKKNKIKINDYSFYTTSYYVYSYLKRKNYIVEQADKYIKTEDFDNIGQFSFKFSNEQKTITNSFCQWRKFYNIGDIISQSIFLNLNTYCYKNLILNKLILKAKKLKSKLIVLGFSKINSNDFKLDRTENIFLMLAKKMKVNNLDFIDFNEDNQNLKKIDKFSGEFKKNLLNKILILLDNNINSITFKIIKKLFKSISTNPFSKNITYIYGENHSYIENFLKILINSKKIIFIKKIPKIEIFKTELLDNNQKEILCKIYLKISKNFGNLYLNDNLIFDLFFQKYLNVIEGINKNLENHEKLFEKILINKGEKNFLFCNGFYSIEEKLFEEFCLEKQIITVGFEHGATTSISNFRKIYDYFHGSKKTKIGVYYTNRAKKFMDTVKPNQFKLVSGVPKKYNQKILFNNKFFNFLLKKILNLPTKKKLILLIADIDVNNFILSPQRDTNYKYIKKTKILLNYLKKYFSDYHIVIKLYPGQRFINPYYFKHEINNQVSRIQNIDLRFISNLFDKVITTSTDSGLGWALCSNKDLLFKSFYWAKSDYVYQELYNLNKRKLLKINKDEFLMNEDINLIKNIYKN